MLDALETAERARLRSESNWSRMRKPRLSSTETSPSRLPTAPEALETAVWASTTAGLCDLAWGEARRDAPDYSAVGTDWAIITEFSRPAPDRFVRDITTFVPGAGGLWRRDREHHENVLIDTAQIPALLGQHGVQARVSASFGAETLPAGLRAITGHKPAPGA